MTSAAWAQHFWDMTVQVLTQALLLPYVTV